MALRKSLKLAHRAALAPASYVVVKAVNTTEFTPGQGLTKDQVDQVIRRSIQVEVVG